MDEGFSLLLILLLQGMTEHLMFTLTLFALHCLDVSKYLIVSLLLGLVPPVDVQVLDPCVDHSDCLSLILVLIVDLGHTGPEIRGGDEWIDL